MEMMNSVLVTLVLKMKEIVITIIIVLVVFIVDRAIAQAHLVLTLELIVVIHALAPMVILTGKVINIVMMRTTIVDVIGMEETVVEDYTNTDYCTTCECLHPNAGNSRKQTIYESVSDYRQGKKNIT